MFSTHSIKLCLLLITFCICTVSTPAQTATHKTPYDFDGDNKTDFTVYRPSISYWNIFQSQSQTARLEAFGVSTDRIVPGDYDGDGKDDLAVFRPTDMTWYIQQSRDGFRFQQWGLSGDLPFAGDFDGDGKTDLVVIRTGPDNLFTWHILRSQAGYLAVNFGQVGDIPVRGNFDGDNKAEVAYWRPSNGGWYYISSMTNQTVVQQWGMGSLGDMVGAGDYDGDNKTDLAVWRSTTGTWYIRQSSNNATVIYQFGGSAYGDVPVPGDYDGDGKYDYAVWRAPTGVWHVQRSQQGYLAQQWGSIEQGDKLAPFAFVPTGTVVGTVKSDADVPISGALIEVTEQGVLKAATTSSSTGYFFLPGVRTGQYEIRVSYKAANAAASADCSTDTYQDTRLNDIGLVAGGTTTVNVTLARQKICFEDNFGEAALRPVWQKGLIGEANWNDNSVSLANQRLEIAIPAAPSSPSPGNRFSGIRSVNTYNLRDAYVAARIAKVPVENNATYDSQAQLEVGINSNLKIGISVSERLILWKKNGDVYSDLTNILYSRGPKAYVRIRFKYEPQPGHPNRGLLFLETSPTGSEGSWVTEGSNDVVFEDFDLSAVTVSLNAGSWGQTAPITAALDDFKFAKYNALTAKADDDQTLAHNNIGTNVGGVHQCDGCTSISGLSFYWRLASKPAGAPDPVIHQNTSAGSFVSGINFPGTYNFQFTVTGAVNGQSYTSSDTDIVSIHVAEAPVARITAPDSVMEDEPIVFDGSLSSGADSYEWSFGDGRKAELARSTHLYMTPGSRTVTLKAINETGAFATTTKNITVTPLPSPSPTNIVTLPPCDVNANHNLVTAIDAATGRTDIVLRAGCDYGGNASNPIVLPNKSGSDYIVIRSAASLPPKGTRISEANLANMAIISTPLNGLEAMNAAHGAHHYRFVGVLFRRHPAFSGHIQDLISLSDEGSIPPLLTNKAHHMIFDRCIFSNIALDPNNPNPSTSVQMKRALTLHTGSTSVINSYFKHIKDSDESKAISSWSGVGPHAIINNYIEAAGMGILYGGGYMNILYASPSDITVRGNYFFKPIIWRTEDNVTVKNIFELKHAKHVIVDGNTMQNSFPRGQAGEAFVLTTLNDSELNEWTTVQNVQITNNRIDYVGRGVNISGLDANGDPSIPASHFIIRNNLWTRIGEVPGTIGQFMYVSGMPDRFWVSHNTVFHTNDVLYSYGGVRFTVHSGFRFDNNILKHNLEGGMVGEFAGSGLGFLNTFAPGWLMRRNVMFFPPEKDSARPLYPNDMINFNRYIVDGSGAPTFLSQFVNLAQGNYRLVPGSFGYQWATDGSDVGCNIDQLDAATAGSTTGNWPLP